MTLRDYYWKDASFNDEDQAEVLIINNRIFGWAMRSEGTWIARLESGIVRAAFDSKEEAKDFVILMANVDNEKE